MNRPVLPNLDDALYPLEWNAKAIPDALSFLRLVVSDLFHSQSIDDITQLHNPSDVQSYIEQNHAKRFSEVLISNEIYQKWINFTFYGRYVQRSFMAFYQQQEGLSGHKQNKLNPFTHEMPDILFHELKRHGQYLPAGQTLFFSGELAQNVRQEKILLTTLNPYTVVSQAIQQSKSSPNYYINNNHHHCNQPLIINHVTITGKQVLAFAIKHNKRTRQHTKNEVMILDFVNLRLRKEETMMVTHQFGLDKRECLLRFYEMH